VTTLPPTDPLDDDAIGALVRGAAADWSMPAVRLEAPGWRERVRTPRTRRAAGLRGAFGRLGQATGAAIALTVGAALLGVWLSTPRDTGKPNSSPGGSETPNPTGLAAATPLPKLFVDGAVPYPSSLLVSVDSSYALLDLGSGTLGNPIALGAYGSDLRRNVGGVPFCICLTADGYTNGGYTRMTVTYQQYDVAGATNGPPVAIGDYRGSPDPRDGAVPEQPQHVSVRVTYVDQQYAYVGWAVRDHPSWRSGLAVVDTTSGAVLNRVDLPDRSDGDGDTRVYVDAPRVVGLTGDGRLVITRPWYSWSPPASQSPTLHFGYDAFSASAFHGTLANVAAFPSAQACGEDLELAGARPDASGAWLACRSAVPGQTVFRLIGSDGSVDDVPLALSLDAGGEPGSSAVVSPDGRSIYAWDPAGLAIARVDLASGAVTTGSATAAAAPLDPLAALGRWLAPTAAAKVLLSSGIAISPDGSRIYALGVDPGGTLASDLPGSSGVLVFDASSLRNVGRWPPTADFVSVAVSSDGRFIYAAGSPRVSATGQDTSQPASVTVFDASTGRVRLIAGSLGSGFLTFPARVVP